MNVCGFPAGKVRGRHDHQTPTCSYARLAMTTYAVTWREPDGQIFVGRLALGAGALRLDGRRRGADGRTVSREFGYAQLRGSRFGSRGAERLDGRPTLIVEQHDGAYLIADVGLGAPIIRELVDRLAELRPV
jgi:hypothetical protein